MPSEKYSSEQTATYACFFKFPFKTTYSGLNAGKIPVPDTVLNGIILIWHC